TVVQVTLLTGTGYDLGAAALAQVSIEPLQAQVSITAVANTAEKATQSPGIYSVVRGGILSSAISVRLGLGGSASTVTDYTITDDSGRTISTAFPVLSLAANQTEAFIYITPKTTATVATAPKYVVVSLKTNATYKVMSPSFDYVYIVNQLFNGQAWEQAYFPGAAADWNTFANQDTGNRGVKNLYRYVFGLNPTNPAVASGMPAYQVVNDHLAVTFRHPLAVTDYTYIPQVSDDMVNWSALPSEVEAYTPAGANTNDVETVYYRAKNSVHGGKPKQFMRVLVQPN
ncbi:MAG TPA: hypothetical protein VF607_01960, partial [Verrucomicrobiae bacterium]